MERTLVVFAVLFLIQSTRQYSLGGPNNDRMVSETWFDDILTDGWNGVPRGCGGKPADVYFVLDTALDTEPEAVQEQKRFLTDLSALFYLRKGATRVGIVSYGHAPITATPLGASVTLPEVQSAVQDAPRVGGSRHTSQALRYLREQSFSPLVARKEVAHLVILMTNGYSTDAKQIAMEASLLRKQGVYVYVVSVTSPGHVDKRELSEIASSPLEKFMFSSADLSIVDSLIDLLHIKECNYQVLPPLLGKEPVCVSRRPTQLVFALEHLALGSSSTQSLIAFIQNLLAEVDPDSDIEAAILTSKDPVSRGALPRQMETIQYLEHRLGRVTFPDLGDLLKRARRTATRTAAARDNSSSGRYANVQKVLVIFMDESVQLTKKALAAARSNHRHKLDTYVVYVGEAGNALQSGEVAQLASGQDHVIRVSRLQLLQLQSTVVDTLSTVCRGL